MKHAVNDETHYMQPNEKIRLQHENIVKNSFVASQPVVVSYKNGTIRTLDKSKYPLVVEGDGFKIMVSYVYDDMEGSE